MIFEVYLSKNLRGTLLAICGLGSSFALKFTGDTACDLRFGKFICSKNLRGTLLAICDLESLLA